MLWDSCQVAGILAYSTGVYAAIWFCRAYWRDESGLLEKIRSGQPGIEPCPIPLSPRMDRGIES